MQCKLCNMQHMGMCMAHAFISQPLAHTAKGFSAVQSILNLLSYLKYKTYQVQE